MAQQRELEVARSIPAAAPKVRLFTTWPSPNLLLSITWKTCRCLVVHEALPPGNVPSVGKLLDMQMLLIGGRERTEAEYRTLFETAGFELRRVIPTPSPLHVIEGIAVAT
jgi:hypothetical protein